jgi:transcriptional regulator with XRE-family HTH domain
MLGISRDGLAEKLGVGLRDIEGIENGTPHLTARDLDALSRALAVPVAFFFDDSSTAPEAAAPDASVLIADQNQALRSALRLLLIAVNLADGELGIEEDHYQAAKSTAWTALAAD